MRSLYSVVDFMHYLVNEGYPNIIMSMVRLSITMTEAGNSSKNVDGEAFRSSQEFSKGDFTITRRDTTERMN